MSGDLHRPSPARCTMGSTSHRTTTRNRRNLVEAVPTLFPFLGRVFRTTHPTLLRTQCDRFSHRPALWPEASPQRASRALSTTQSSSHPPPTTAPTSRRTHRHSYRVAPTQFTDAAPYACPSHLRRAYRKSQPPGLRLGTEPPSQ